MMENYELDRDDQKRIWHKGTQFDVEIKKIFKNKTSHIERKEIPI